MHVRTAEKRLRQILVNLLSNAIKFTETGRIDFEVGYRSQVATFVVRDTGPGIASDEVEHIFEPFVRGKSERSRLLPGLGLGLTITKLLSETLGGEIVVESEPGAGSTFRVRLMLARVNRPALRAAQDSKVGGYAGPRRTIAVVDDNADHRELMRELLQPLGFTVLTANDAADCLMLLEGITPDLYFIDISMPGIDGWELVKRLRAQGRMAPIIMLSANIGDGSAAANIDTGHNDTITKPFDVRQVLDKLEAHLKLEWLDDAKPPARRLPADERSPIGSTSCGPTRRICWNCAASAKSAMCAASRPSSRNWRGSRRTRPSSMCCGRACRPSTSKATRRFSRSRPGMTDAPPSRDTVLAVDDSPESLGFLTEALESDGRTVLVAASGEMALRIAARVTPDLILMDAVMPGMDGFETCRRLKALPSSSHVPVIFMTGLTETEHVVHALNSGGVDYLTKPIDLDELRARIRVHLANARSAQSARVALDATGRHLIAFSEAGGILWTTPQAGRLLAASGTGGDGLRAVANEVREWAAAQGGFGGLSGQSVAVDAGTGQALQLTCLGAIGPDEYLFRLSSEAGRDQDRVLRQHFGLTLRESEVLLWIARGKSNRDIAEILGLSPRTVNKHLEQVYAKLGVENRASAAIRATQVLGAMPGA